MAKTPEEKREENKRKQRKYGSRYKDYRAFHQFKTNSTKRDMLDRDDADKILEYAHKIKKRNRLKKVGVGK